MLLGRTPLAVAAIAVRIALGATVFSRAAHPGVTAVGTTAAYLVAGLYVLPSYGVWALPSAALTCRTKLATVVALYAAFLVAVYQFEPVAHPMLTGVAAVARTGVIQLGAWIAIGAYITRLLRARRTHKSRGISLKIA